MVVVRRIFKEVASGTPMFAVKAALEAEGIPAPGGIPAGAPGGCDPVPGYEPINRVPAGQERDDRRLLLDLQTTLLDSSRT
jgi:hypothetical protein